MLYVPTLSISKAPVAPKAFRSVAASAAGAIAAAGCSIVITGLGILTVGAEAEDAGHALKQCIKFVFGVVVAEHVLVLHDLLIHGTELLIEALKGLIIAVLFLSCVGDGHTLQIELANGLLQSSVLIAGLAGSHHGNVALIVLQCAAQFSCHFNDIHCFFLQLN